MNLIDLARWRLVQKNYKASTNYGVADSWIAEALQQAKAGNALVDLVNIGDSNTSNESMGWMHGLLQGFRDRGGNIYSTGFVSASCAAGSGLAINLWSTASSAIGVTSGAPSHLDGQIVDFAGMATQHQYAYLDANNATPTPRLTWFPDRFGASAGETWRAWFEYGNFATGGGSFNISIRLDQSPYTNYANSDVACNTGDNIVLGYLDGTVPTTSRTAIRIGPVTANAWFGYLCADRLDALYGVCSHLLAALGGWQLQGSSLTSLWKQIRYKDADTVGRFLVRIRRKQMLHGFVPKIIIVIGMTPNTQENVLNDWHSSLIQLIDWLRGAYSRAGGIEDELGFILIPGHRVDDTPSAWQQMRSACAAAAESVALQQPRVACVNLHTALTHAQMQANGWYASGGGDVSHLAATGFVEVSSLIWRNQFGL